jgi:HSP20 family protein
MHSSHWDPMDELTELRECLEPAGADLRRGRRRRASGVAWHAPVDVYETTNQIVVLADVVGADPKTVVVRIVADVLVVEGVVAAEPKKEPRVYHRHDRCSGPFRLVVKLPVSVLPESLSVAVERWGLKIQIPKSIQETTAGESPRLAPSSAAPTAPRSSAGSVR